MQLTGRKTEAKCIAEKLKKGFVELAFLPSLCTEMQHRSISRLRKKYTSTTSVPPFCMREVRYLTSSDVNEQEGFTY
jgi:hypothetical protein